MELRRAGGSRRSLKAVLWIALRAFREIKGTRSTWEEIRTTKDPTTFVVPFEDTAALTGLLVAFGGIYLGHRFDNPYFDGAASLVIGVILMGVAGFLGFESKGLLIGEGASAETLHSIRTSRGGRSSRQGGEKSSDDVLRTAHGAFDDGGRIRRRAARARANGGGRAPRATNSEPPPRDQARLHRSAIAGSPCAFRAVVTCRHGSTARTGTMHNGCREPQRAFHQTRPTRHWVGGGPADRRRFPCSPVRAIRGRPIAEAGVLGGRCAGAPWGRCRGQATRDSGASGAGVWDAPIERFVERFRDIEQFASVPGTLQIGRFNTPPRLGDLASLTLPAKDLEALPRCHPGDCEVKLSAAAMTRFKQQVKWSAPTAARQANEVAREMLLELVRGYQVNGTAALGQYNDDDTPLSVAEQFALLTSGGQLPIPVPALMSYLDEYPRGRPPGAEDFFYWAIVDFGLKPTIRVNHVTIYPLAASPSAGAAYAIAIKQLYASHYFHTTLELRFLVPDNRPGRRGFYLVSFTRSRSDGMTGFKGALVRPIINRRSRDAVRRYLEHIKRQVERPTRRTSEGACRADRRELVSLTDVILVKAPCHGLDRP